ncbi:MAG: hypothetical protein WBZ32_04960, partial [Candidatus Acidiferrales bacterium]
LDRLPAADVSASADSARSGDTIHLRVHLKNDGTAAALETKITILNAADASRILPAYLSDNYVSLLPGESREIDAEYPAAAHGAAQIAIRGWNLASRTISVTAAK